MEVCLGMKRKTMVKLRDALTDTLESDGDRPEVVIYGDKDSRGYVLTINNEDMERDELPDDVIYVEMDD